MKKVYVSFANEKYKRSLEILQETAVPIGKVDEFIPYTREWLVTTEFYRKNRYILDKPRGGGYWAWKPFIIMETMKNLENGDIVMYSDAGMSVIDNLNILFEIAASGANNGKMLFQVPDGHLIKTWTKKDCYVLTGCDSPKYYDRVMVNGAVSLWKKSDENIEFLKEWQRFLRDPRIVTDDPNMTGPNLPSFRDHRHDQSVLSLMYVRNGYECFRDPTQFGLKEKDQFTNSPYGQLLNHHRGDLK